MEDDAQSAAEGDGGVVSAAPISMSMAQSSIGVSFVVASETESVTVTAEWGQYQRIETAEQVLGEAAGGIASDGELERTPQRKRTGYAWRRIPHRVEVEIALRTPGRQPPLRVGDDVLIDSTVRDIGDRKVVSVFLVNSRRSGTDRRPPDELWLYQPGLRVRGAGDPFIARELGKATREMDPDVASADLVYRGRLEFATGHGVAVAWRSSSANSQRAEELWTEVVPGREIAPVVPWEAPQTPALDMLELGGARSALEVETIIQPLLNAYRAWIRECEGTAETLSQAHQSVARDHMRLASRCLGRMEEGLQLLRDDPRALAAFQFANRAMASQRRASVRVLAKRRGKKVPEAVSATWRSFQLGFILQCLPGLANPDCPDREVADLLWFPTGGGKTEAYLGLAAFTMAYRRTRTPSDTADTSAGTVVLMRYTLRLLTIQQFQRATALICACELLRREDPGRWGDEPFAIGLWVGSSVTPTSYEESKEALIRLKSGEILFEASPFQVQFCPWCGRDLPPDHYSCDDDRERTLVKCDGDDCPFSMARSELGLPILLVDQEIYRNPPSLLFATVDKFAQMAWNGRIQSLFGRVTSRCPRHGFLSAGEGHPAQHHETPGWPATKVVPLSRLLAPPELIIQDELHLISGPLGSLVGIYESAVEGLCVREVDGRRVRPKIVASTATIRGASHQVAALFNRDVAVFPPQGLDAGDSFFARQDQSSPGRQHIGVYAPGKSVKTSLVRVYAAMLSRARFEFEADPSPETDSYMTLVGYFNSLRELGGALRLIDDDVPARLRVLERRRYGPGRLIYEKKELTSRARSHEITSTLKLLDRTFESRASGSYPIDVLLASNMLSVGVDIDRLGLMVVSAQPKTSAEYIQATSRVGRRYPGLVIEVFNWVRPRDTSHYEQFGHYHDTMYRHVEATSVTPWSARARDRALAGVLISYLRLHDPLLSIEAAANLFDPSSTSVQEVLTALVGRAYEVTGRGDVRLETEQQLQILVDEWHQFTSPPASRPIVYSGRGLGRNDGSKSVLMRPMERQSGRGLWPVAGSLREVEEEIPVVLLDAGGLP
jgi:hypothetical protein